MVALAGAVVVAKPGAELLERILAVVDGQVILQSDVQLFLDLGLVDVPEGADAKNAALTFLIERQVVLDQLNRVVPGEPNPAAIEDRLERIRSWWPTRGAFQAVLARAGRSEDDLRRLLADETRREAYVADRFGAVSGVRRAESVRAWIAGLVDRARIRRIEE